MSTYQSTLPQVFPFTFRVLSVDIPAFVEALVSPFKLKSGGFAAGGSSFAITSDAELGYMNMWLSNVSLERLTDLGML